MIVDLRLQNFRSYGDESFEFSKGVNIIVGPNASGKTNLLEAILVIARGSSYRAPDTDLISFDKPWSRLDSLDENNSKRTVKIVRQPAGKLHEIDGKSLKRLSLERSLPVVLFEPDHLRLLSGGPDGRRDYLDDLLEQTEIGFGHIRRQYRRALAQRNRLLKQESVSLASQLFPWDVRLSQLGGQIVRYRHDLVQKLDKKINQLYKQLSKTQTKVTVEYSNNWPPKTYESNMLKKLEASQADDRLRGFTGSGPHREDMVVKFDDRPAQETASRGEVRTAVLALKIAELEVLAVSRGQTPLLLLDDVFSELDGQRRHALTDHLAAYQTFITTTDADLVTQHFTKNCQVIPLRNE